MDIILENLGAFWGFTEVQLDALAKKSQLAEQYVAYGNSSLEKPKLYARFMERITEYKSFWIGVQKMCATYMTGNMKSGGNNNGGKGNGESASEFSSYADDCFGTHTEFKSSRVAEHTTPHVMHTPTTNNGPRVVTPMYGTPMTPMSSNNNNPNIAIPQNNMNIPQYDMSKIDSL